MSFPKYPAYKDSEVEWIREIPVGWNLLNGRRLFADKKISAQSGDEQLSATQKYGVIPQKDFMKNEDQKVTLAISGIDNFRHVDEGDFVISLRSFQGGIEYSYYKGCVSPAYTVLCRKNKINDIFWSYLFKSRLFIDEINASSEGIRDGKTIRYEQFGKIAFAIPSLPEQQAIASFLDRECGKIDGLIAEQERLIALLAEKRQAVISHAVTKGLNPNAPMKDSGIPWIGMVPEGWDVKCLRYVCDFEQGKAHEPFFDDDGEFICATARFVSTSGSSFKRCNTCLTKAEKRDILMVMSDLPNGRALARAFLVTENNIAINQRICKIVPRIGNECFYYYQLDRNQGLLKYDDKVNQTHLSNNAYKALPLIVPPLDEQNRIASYLQTFDEENVRLNQELLGSLILLKERRAALISAAVTGKIDVRAQSKAIAA